MDVRYLPASLEGKVGRLEEEIGEVLQAKGKISRHGWFATDPHTGIEYNNKMQLLNEIDDLIHAAQMLRDALQTHKCDGNHGGPRCSDIECWNQ